MREEELARNIAVREGFGTETKFVLQERGRPRSFMGSAQLEYKVD